VFFCVWKYTEEIFVKKTLKLLRVNKDPQYLQDEICKAFPDVASGTFKLWQLRENRTELIPLPVDVNTAHALINFDALNRSCIYIKADVSSRQ